MNIVQHKSRNRIGLSDSKDGTKLVLLSLEVVIIRETFRFTYDNYQYLLVQLSRHCNNC
jgi:secreted protein with Ig-like and vWFA domain